jgi:hypothetical protein
MPRKFSSQTYAYCYFATQPIQGGPSSGHYFAALGFKGPEATDVKRRNK